MKSGYYCYSKDLIKLSLRRTIGVLCPDTISDRELRRRTDQTRVVHKAEVPVKKEDNRTVGHALQWYPLNQNCRRVGWRRKRANF